MACLCRQRRRLGRSRQRPSLHPRSLPKCLRLSQVSIACTCSPSKSILPSKFPSQHPLCRGITLRDKQLCGAKVCPPICSTDACAAGEMPSFEVAAEEREYRGDPDDRKALMAHRKQLQERERDLEKKRMAWLAARQAITSKSSPHAAKVSASCCCLPCHLVCHFRHCGRRCLSAV